MPAKAKSKSKTKIKDIDNGIACIHLKTLNEITNSLQPLCLCEKRDLILGKMAAVCSVCQYYSESENLVVEMYVSDQVELDNGGVLWDAEDLFEIVRADEDDLEDEEDEDDDELKPRKKNKKKSSKKKVDEEDDDDLEIVNITEEEEKISEELFGGVDDEEEEEEFEDETSEVTKEYDAKEAKLKNETDDNEFDETPVAGARGRSGAKEVDLSNFEMPEIKKTPEGKEICPYCRKEFAMISRHISRCKRAPPEAAAFYKKKKSTKKKKSSKKK